jgi:hypothetical protein
MMMIPNLSALSFFTLEEKNQKLDDKSKASQLIIIICIWGKTTKRRLLHLRKKPKDDNEPKASQFDIILYI